VFRIRAIRILHVRIFGEMLRILHVNIENAKHIGYIALHIFFLGIFFLEKRENLKYFSLSLIFFFFFFIIFFFFNILQIKNTRKTKKKNK